jgi:hypothetical protein
MIVWIRGFDKTRPDSLPGPCLKENPLPGDFSGDFGINLLGDADLGGEVVSAPITCYLPLVSRYSSKNAQNYSTNVSIKSYG